MTRGGELIGIAAGMALSPSGPSKVFFGEDPIEQELFQLLDRKNGFYAFESALHVFPSNTRWRISVERWNSATLWRNEYGSLADCLWFFAQDIFGRQFCIERGAVCLFDPETGKCDKIASDLEGWADCVLTDYDYFTGYSIARRWQEEHGAIPPDHRLFAKVPFVAGGQYEVSNLCLLEAVEGMRWRGNLARQINNLPDRAAITLEVVNAV